MYKNILIFINVTYIIKLNMKYTFIIYLFILQMLILFDTSSVYERINFL